MLWRSLLVSPRSPVSLPPQDTLDLSEYFHTHPGDGAAVYHLTGVVTHHGRTVNSGHYTAFGRDVDGEGGCAWDTW